ncbi:MAG: hypothetical protein KAT34_08260, partial [Candidatus Aminicenantes bacterium]|nr:hypothetical protein [Candidatus Aminicenantes bacterium]
MEKRIYFTSTRRLLAVIFITQLFFYHLWGLNPDKSVDRYLIDSWEIAEGFPSNEVTSIAQTPDGYLWIATSKGLVRFDGITFSIISFAKKEEISPL